MTKTFSFAFYVVAGGEGEGEGMETIKRNTKGSLLEES
jgi:hypothetical protein